MAQNTTENIQIKLDILADKSLKSIKDMRDEMKLLNQAMSDPNIGKAQFDTLAQRMGELKNDTLDANKAMRALDPGELLSGFTKMAQGAVGAFGAVTGAMDLFGSENEVIQEIQKKSMTIIQLMMGLESARQLLIDNGARKENAAYIKTFANQVKKVLGLGVETAATTANTVAQGANATATTAVATATWGWNAALLANPVVLITAGVAALAAGIYLLVSAMDKQEKGAVDAARATKGYTEAVSAAIEEGTKDLARLSSLTEGTKEYSKELYNLSIKYQDYLSDTDEARLRQADLSTAIDIATDAIAKQAEVMGLSTAIEKYYKQIGDLKIRQQELNASITELDADLSKNRFQIWELADLKEELAAIPGEINKIKSNIAELTNEQNKLTASTKGSSLETKESIIAKLEQAKTEKEVNKVFNESSKVIKENTDVIKAKKEAVDKLRTSQKKLADETVKQNEDARKTQEKELNDELSNLNELKLAKLKNIELQLAEQQRLVEVGKLVSETGKAFTDENQKGFEVYNDLLKKYGILGQSAAISAATSLAKSMKETADSILLIDKAINTATVSLAAMPSSTITELDKLNASLGEVAETSTEIFNINQTEESKNKAISALNDYITALEKLPDSTEVKLEITNAKNQILEIESFRKEESKKGEKLTQEEISKIRQQAYDRLLKLQIETAKEGTRAQTELIKEAIDRDAEYEIQEHKKTLDAKTINESEYQALVAKINEKAAKDKRALEKETRDFMLDQAQMFTDASAQILQNQADHRNEVEEYQRNEKYDKEIEAVNSLADAELITTEEKEKRLKEIEDNKRKEEKAAKERIWKSEKEAALIQVAINTAVAIMKAAPVIPLQLATGFAGLAQAAVIQSQQMPIFELGGLIKGRKHASGGTLINAEDGEVVINAKSSQMFRSQLSAINQAGGGVSFPSVPNVASSSSTMISTIDESAVRSIVSEVVGQMSAIPVIISESDMTKTQRKIKTYETNSSY